MPVNLENALIAIVVIFIIGVFVGYLWIEVDWNRVKGKKMMLVEPTIDNELRFYRQYQYSGAYSNEDRRKREKLSQILDYFRRSVKNEGGVNIEAKFNGLIYPVFDLDNQEQFELFKKLYSTETHAIIRSSTEHYWGILDAGTEKIEEIFYNPNWKSCNDQQYVEFSREFKTLYLRGIYQTADRKPRIYETNGTLSKNFQLFIDKLIIYYNKEGLELSVLRYKDPKLLIKFNRKGKLKQIQENENNS